MVVASLQWLLVLSASKRMHSGDQDNYAVDIEVKTTK
jgi:hypothetical protein